MYMKNKVTKESVEYIGLCWFSKRPYSHVFSLVSNILLTASSGRTDGASSSNSIRG